MRCCWHDITAAGLDVMRFRCRWKGLETVNRLSSRSIAQLWLFQISTGTCSAVEAFFLHNVLYTLTIIIIVITVNNLQPNRVYGFLLCFHRNHGGLVLEYYCDAGPDNCVFSLCNQGVSVSSLHEWSWLDFHRTYISSGGMLTFLWYFIGFVLFREPMRKSFGFFMHQRTSWEISADSALQMSMKNWRRW